MSLSRVYSLLIVLVIINNIVLHVLADYDFNVITVEKCPMSQEDWDMASARLKCNSTHGYHCVPNKQFTSLIEFCYPRGPKLPFESGNCLKLASSGILNQVPCNTFVDGCPKNHYFSDKLFNYPKCLMINKWLGCFEADYECIYLGVLKSKEIEENFTTTENPVNQTCKKCDIPAESNSPAVITALAILLAISVSALLISCVFICCKRVGQSDQLRYDLDHPLMARCSNHDDQIQNDAALCLEATSIKMSQNLIECRDQASETERFIHDYDADSELEDDSIYFSDAESSKGVNEVLLKQLQDAIISNDEKTFEHFCREVDKNALEKLNNRGFNCLHLSAKCGNQKIFLKILEFDVDIELLTSDKRNVLHIAAFYGSYPICKHILKNHKKLFDVKDRYNMNAAHWAALNGQEGILKLMLQWKCNLSETTPKYEENIVLFACIGESYDVCNFVGSNKDIAGLLHAENSEGWNSIQYAAKSGNINVFKYLTEMGVSIENTSEQTGKNCLHTACEKGSIDICKYILEEKKNETLIKGRDKHGQHVGHFAAKNGNIEILELLSEQLKGTLLTETRLLESATPHNINILHIACRHARVDMCVKIADTFPALVNEITEKGWNAALFITEKAGAERERIRILNFLGRRSLNVYHVTRSGKTILYNACVNRSPMLVNYLLQHYPDLVNIEKSMDPRKAANSQEIEDVFQNYFENVKNAI